MSRIAIPSHKTTMDSEMIGGSLRTYWRQIEPHQRLLYAIGIVLIGSGIFHTGVFLVQGGGLSGSVSWRKPITFGFSIGIAALSISWLTTYLQHNPRKGRWLLGTLAIGGAIEVFLISMQQWRGVPSHFNFFDNPVDAVIAGSITFAIIPISLAILLVTIWSFRPMTSSPSLTWAIRVGMVLMVLGTLFGMTMIANAAYQFSNQTGRPPNIFGNAGMMKVPHALALHALQVLLVAAWLLRLTRWPEGTRLIVIGLIGLGYVGLIAVGTVQTFSGLAPFDLSIGPATGGTVSVTLVCLGYLGILVNIWRKQLHVTSKE